MVAKVLLSSMAPAARRGKGISDSAAADLIASHAPLRTRRHKARQNGPKHYPQGIQGDRNPLGTPFSPIFRRATKDGATGGRQLPNAAGKYVKQKDYATGGRWFSREVGKKRAAKDGATGGRCPPNAAGKNVQRKISPPEVVGRAERPVKT